MNLRFVLMASLLNSVWCFSALSPPGEYRLILSVSIMMLTNLIVCVTKCWDNSKFVSTCSSETSCLCKDVFFQSVSVFSSKGASVRIWPSYQAVLQCLYTQCQTSQFGAAVHHALLQCSTYETNDSSDLPPLIRRQGLRKRSNRILGNVSSYASASVIRSIVRGSPAFSAFYNPYPSQSVAPTTISDQEEQNTSAKPRLFPTSSAVLNATVISSTLSSGIWSPLPTPPSLQPDWYESSPPNGYIQVFCKIIWSAFLAAANTESTTQWRGALFGVVQIILWTPLSTFSHGVITNPFRLF